MSATDPKFGIETSAGALAPGGAPRPSPGRPLFASGLLIAALSTLFWIFPSIDHAATGLFYSTETWFPARTDAVWMAFRRFGIDFSLAMSILVLVLAVSRTLFWQYPPVLSGRKLAFLISTAALGPGLLVNLILKDFWGRPRPHMVEEYGGQMPYTKVWEITDRCADNCSFVSGEAASSFWILAFVLLLPKGMRLLPALVVIVIGASLSINRIAFGGHFLSDVVISWSLMLFVLILMKALILDRTSETSDPYDAALTGIGRSVSGLFAKRAH